jgi:hypothetical protein
MVLRPRRSTIHAATARYAPGTHGARFSARDAATNVEPYLAIVRAPPSARRDDPRGGSPTPPPMGPAAMATPLAPRRAQLHFGLSLQSRTATPVSGTRRSSAFSGGVMVRRRSDHRTGEANAAATVTRRRGARPRRGPQLPRPSARRRHARPRRRLAARRAAAVLAAVSRATKKWRSTSRATGRPPASAGQRPFFSRSRRKAILGIEAI